VVKTTFLVSLCLSSKSIAWFDLQEKFAPFGFAEFLLFLGGRRNGTLINSIKRRGRELTSER